MRGIHYARPLALSPKRKLHGSTLTRSPFRISLYVFTAQSSTKTDRYVIVEQLKSAKTRKSNGQSADEPTTLNVVVGRDSENEMETECSISV